MSLWNGSARSRPLRYPICLTITEDMQAGLV
jgi:hypothetical protein